MWVAAQWIVLARRAAHRAPAPPLGAGCLQARANFCGHARGGSEGAGVAGSREAGVKLAGEQPVGQMTSV